jgi:hypothetical protein
VQVSLGTTILLTTLTVLFLMLCYQWYEEWKWKQTMKDIDRKTINPEDLK